MHGKRDISPKRSQRLRSKRVPDVEHEDDHGSSGMSLDVLAHVASETLKKEPRSSKKASHKKVSLRSICNIDVLSLDQILGLTEKTILNFFTEASSNELSRTFTYSCKLMPGRCDKLFTSFGSEMRARSDVKKHIYEHLDQLEKQDASSHTKFTAETVPARQRRLMNKFGSPKRIVGSKKTKLPAPSMELIRIRESDKTKKRSKENYVNNLENDMETDGVGFIPVAKKLQSNAVSKEILQNQNQSANAKMLEDENSDDENEKRIEENEQFIIELLSKTHPHHDHSYTTIFGKRKNSDYVLRMLKNIGDEHVVEKIDATTGSTTGSNDSKSGDRPKRIVTFYHEPPYIKFKKKRPTPILFLRHRSPDENVPMVSKEEIIDLEPSKEWDEENADLDNEVQLDNTISRGEKPYPPMPKSSLAKRGRLGFDISDISDCSDDGGSNMHITRIKINPLGREGREGNLGWEPKLAMRYIRELKGRKKGDHVPLKCKICNDKTFTAAATLLYHYRSHAGFKPFVCLICNTTFTRQHSLNYHMLIHNNQSRFTCKDCGRKFRHPSHFKEHLRRHTGETPFECKDCGQKFKTRNTYKRHLKTRHGKLLTASGIHTMSVEEFAKVRTKKYHIPRYSLPDITYQMPELTFTSRLRNRTSGDDTDGKDGDQAADGNSDTDDKMIFEELKQDIKKEIASDSDPELSNILEVLSQNADVGEKMQVECSEFSADRNPPEKSIEKSFTKYVFASGHTLTTTNVDEICKQESATVS